MAGRRGVRIVVHALPGLFVLLLAVLVTALEFADRFLTPPTYVVTALLSQGWTVTAGVTAEAATAVGLLIVLVGLPGLTWRRIPASVPHAVAGRPSVGTREARHGQAADRTDPLRSSPRAARSPCSRLRYNFRSRIQLHEYVRNAVRPDSSTIRLGRVRSRGRPFVLSRRGPGIVGWTLEWAPQRLYGRS